MRVLVTGDTGYIGSVMVPVLEAQGHAVTGLDTGYFDGCLLHESRPAPRRLRADVRDLQPSALEGFDAIVHLAALSNDPLGDLNAAWTFDINLEGSRRLAELAREAGVSRFLFASSCSMYGASAGDALLDESAPLNPLTPYAESKVRLEEALTALASDTFSPVFLRNATAYGVSPHLRADIVLNNLVAWAFTTGKVRIMSDGTPWRPLVHVEDICRVFALMLTAPRDVIHGQAFNVGQDRENYQVRDLGEIVRQTVPGCEVEYAGGPAASDPRNYRVAFGKLATTFPDFALQWDAPRGARQLYDAYREAGLTLDDLQGRKFIRLNQLKHLIEHHLVDDGLRWT
jgi:nucleoside-diphosphate-sugar epimerase